MTADYCRSDCKYHCGDGQESAAEECDGDSSPNLPCTEITGTQAPYDIGLVTTCSSCQLDLSPCRDVLQEGLYFQNPIKGLFGFGPNDVFAVGDNRTILYLNGGTWHDETPTQLPQGRILWDIWGKNPADTFAVGSNGTILRRGEGTTIWQAAPPLSNSTLYGVWGSGDNVFAVGASGTVLQRGSDSIWRSVPLPAPLGEINEDLHAVWGDNDVLFIVGASGTILHREGGSWRSLSPILTNEHLYGVWGHGDDVFIVGDDSTIIRINASGNEWQKMHTPRDNIMFSAVWGTSSSNVMAAGRDGTILHYDGNPDGFWAPVRLPATSGLQGIWSVETTPSGSLPEVVGFFAGNSGQGHRFSYSGR